MKLKKIAVLLAFTLPAMIAQYLAAQDTSSSQPTAPSSQSVTAGKPASNDGDLTQQLQSRFGQDPAFANVQVSVSNGTATITGSVPAKADKKRAKEMAKSISGVKHVKEELTVNPSGGGSTNSSKDNNPTNAGVSSGSNGSSTASAGSAASPTSAPASTTSDQGAASAAPNSTNPANGQTSATSNNPNSQASSTRGAATASSAAAASPATGENASSVQQSTGNAANENNMAGQGPVTPQSAGSTPTTTGAVGSSSSTTQSAISSGAIGANAGGAAPATSSSPTGDMGVSVNDTATLQNQIQNALQNEPTLRNDNLNVAVTDSTIELSGNVQNSKEKETARRIASSFAGNRRVRDRISLSGKSSAVSSPNPSGLDANPATNANPNPNNNPNSQNPSANNPKANGDASANPR